MHAHLSYLDSSADLTASWSCLKPAFLIILIIRTTLWWDIVLPPFCLRTGHSDLLTLTRHFGSAGCFLNRASVGECTIDELKDRTTRQTQAGPVVNVPESQPIAKHQRTDTWGEEEMPCSSPNQCTARCHDAWAMVSHHRSRVPRQLRGATMPVMLII